MNVPKTVLEVLSVAEFDGQMLRLTGKLDRKLYTDTNKVLEACGGKWDPRTKSHVFPEDPRPLIDTVILTGEVRTAQEDGWFPTPPEIADRVVRAAKITGDMSVMEPSAGEGALVLAVRRVAPDAMITAVESNPKRYETLVSRVIGVPTMTHHPANGPWASANAKTFVWRADFKEVAAEMMKVQHARFHRIVMNPPFANSQDVDHVVAAYQLLEPGGILVAIMPAGVEFRQGTKYKAFRKVVEEVGSIEALPEKSFRSAGTYVHTVMVTLQAPA